MIWVFEDRDGHPPDCLGVLLYVCTYIDEQLINQSDSDIYAGFYDEEYKKYILNHPIIRTLGKESYFIENETTKVIAWSFLPRITKEMKRRREEEMKI